jgi:hypothetical protein
MALDAVTKLRIDKITIKTWDILFQSVIDLNIYESLCREGITGTITLADWQGIRELGHVFAGDDIYLTFKSEDRPTLVLKYKIYATKDNRQLLHQTYNTTTFLFCSPWLIDGFGRQLSKPYKDKYIHEIVKDLLEDCGAEVGFIEPTKQKLESFVTPLWTPIHSIRHLLNFAMNKENKGGYVLWTDLPTGKVNMKTLDTIFKGSEGETSRFAEMPANIQYEGAIKDATYEQTWDMIQYMHIGMNKIRNYSLWFDKKQVVETKDNIQDMKYEHLASKFPMDQKYLDKKYWVNYYQCLYPKKADAVTSQEELDDFVKGEQYTRYAYLMTDITKINFQTVGHSERRVGMVAELDLHSQNEADTQTGNLQVNGDYIIRDIRHHISAPNNAQYDQYVTIITDGYHEFERTEVITW